MAIVARASGERAAGRQRRGARQSIGAKNMTRRKSRLPSTAEYEAFLEDRKSKLTLQNTHPYDDLMSGRTSQLRVDDVDALERVLLFLTGLPPTKDRNEATKSLLRVLDPTALAMLEASEPPPSPAPLRLIKDDAHRHSALSQIQNGRDQRTVSRQLSKTVATNASSRDGKELVAPVDIEIQTLRESTDVLSLRMQIACSVGETQIHLGRIAVQADEIIRRIYTNTRGAANALPMARLMLIGHGRRS